MGKIDQKLPVDGPRLKVVLVTVPGVAASFVRSP